MKMAANQLERIPASPPSRAPVQRLPLAIAVILCAMVLVACIALAVPGVRWRLHLLALAVAGRVPEVELRELLQFMRPDSGQVKLARLIDTPSPYAVIRLPELSSEDLERGAIMYRDGCAECHGPDGTGGRGPALVGRPLKSGESDWSVYRTIRIGIPQTQMAAHALPQAELWRLVGHVRALQSRVSHAADVTAPSALAKIGLSPERLAATTLPGDEWLSYTGSYNGQRHSMLEQVTPANVGSLAVRWIHQFAGEPAPIECAPIVHAGRMFVTVPPRVFALDLKTGRTLWERRFHLHSKLPGSEHGESLNRGPALLGERLFVATSDARLFALSALTGQVLWETEVDDPARYHMNGAPLAIGDMVVVGAGMLGGGRGFIAALDADTGRLRWRFNTIPGPGEAGLETWSGDSWRNGGGPTWITGSYDPGQDLLIWGVGNPKPDYDTSVRRGDNLYTNSAVALRASTGELVWHFQFTPADDHDWDSTQTPVLADYRVDGRVDKRVLWANRNGFYYVLDRETGKLVTARPFVFQNWAEGLDATGRPIPNRALQAATAGIVVFPGATGGTNWWSPSYDPALDSFFAPFLEQGATFVPNSKNAPALTPRPFYTGVRALDARTGALRWEYRHESRITDNSTGGLLSTQSGIVFGSDLGTLFALDSRSGKRLFSFDTGARIVAAPVTYRIGDEQHIAIASGRDLITFALPRP